MPQSNIVNMKEIKPWIIALSTVQKKSSGFGRATCK